MAMYAGPLETIDRDEAVLVMYDLLERGRMAEAVVRLGRLLPPDQADVYCQLSDQLKVALVERVPSSTLGSMVRYMGTEDAVRLADLVAPGELPVVLDSAASDVAADILRDLPTALVAETIARMETGPEVSSLLEYEDDDAGGLMTPELIALSERMTVSEAMTSIRRWAREYDSDDISQTYVVDNHGKLTGSVTLSALILARPYQLMSLIMDADVIAVGTDRDQEDVARLVERYDLQRIPVTDERGRLVGTIGVDEVIDVIEDEATEDMYRMVGVSETEKAAGPFWRSVRGRLPWLCVNLMTAIAAGLVITLFQSTMAQAVVLAAFLPVIAGQGGIAGTQTLTLIVRSIALGELIPGSIWKLLAKELGLGLVHGLVVGVLVASIAFGWHRNEFIAIVVGTAMVANMMVAGVSGVVVPMGLRALKIDPALASAVAVTTMTDVVGFLVYLGLAAAMIGLITG